MINKNVNKTHFDYFITKHSEIILWFLIDTIYLTIVFISYFIILANYYINYPSENDIKNYQSISEQIMTCGISSIDDYKDFDVNIHSNDITMNDVLCKSLNDITLKDIDIYLKFDNFYIKNNFSDIFTFYHKNNKLSMIDVKPNNHYSADIMYFAKYNFEIPILMFVIMLIIIILYTIITFINYKKSLKNLSN